MEELLGMALEGSLEASELDLKLTLGGAYRPPINFGQAPYPAFSSGTSLRGEHLAGSSGCTPVSNAIWGNRLQAFALWHPCAHVCSLLTGTAYMIRYMTPCHSKTEPTLMHSIEYSIRCVADRSVFMPTGTCPLMNLH